MRNQHNINRLAHSLSQHRTDPSRTGKFVGPPWCPQT
jgi:hypothetical protein